MLKNIISLSIMMSFGLVPTAPFSRLKNAVSTSIATNSHLQQGQTIEMEDGVTKKNIKLYENEYYQETLEELKKNEARKFSFRERYAGIPKAWKKFKTLFKNLYRKAIGKGTARELKQMVTKLEKDEKLTKCKNAFIQELEKKNYSLTFKNYIEEKSNKAYKQVKKAIRSAGTALYKKKYPIEDIFTAGIIAGQPKNFENAAQKG